MTHVHVTTGSRMHFGLIQSAPASGWRHGGIGLMLRQPGWHLHVSSSCSGPDSVDWQVPEHTTRTLPTGQRDETSVRILASLSMLRSAEAAVPAGIHIGVHAAAPFHCGFGSGTQLALALAAAVDVQRGNGYSGSWQESATRLNRGQRSVIGSVGFFHGGLIVDHGIPAEPVFSRSADSLPVPDNWRFVVLRPADGCGLSGAAEREWFDRNEQLDQSAVARLRHLVNQTLIPAVQTQDFAVFAAALQEYGDAVGAFFAARQGGIYSDPTIADIVARVCSDRLTVAAQSSWGPTVCLPAASPEHADEIRQRITHSAEAGKIQCTVTEAMNCGAIIKSAAPESTRQRSFG